MSTTESHQVGVAIHKMSARAPKVNVTFDPSRIDADPFSITPERVRITRGQDHGVEFVLKTVGASDRRATFSSSGAIQWEDGHSREVACEPGSTRLWLRANGPGNSSHRGMSRMGYHINVKFEGMEYRSAGYPTYEEQDPVPSG